MFLGQAGMFLSFQAKRSSAMRYSTSDLTVHLEKSSAAIFFIFKQKHSWSNVPQLRNQGNFSQAGALFREDFCANVMQGNDFYNYTSGLSSEAGWFSERVREQFALIGASLGEIFSTAATMQLKMAIDLGLCQLKT